MVLIDLPLAAKWAIVIFFYVFTLLLLLLVVGTFSQHLKLPEKLPARQLNILIIGTAVAIYLLVVFYVLNDWADEMLVSY